MVVRATLERRCGASHTSRATRSIGRISAVALIGVGALLPRAASAQQRPASIPPTHTVKKGDTLWDLAKTYLGDAFQWPEIYRLNTDQIEDPHWIYPGEVLKLPGSQPKVVAVTPPAVPPATPPAAASPAPVTPPASAVLPPTTSPAAIDSAQQLEPPHSAIRTGEFAAAPWVDERGGPRGSGYLMQSAELTGIAPADQSRMKLYESVLMAPPGGAAAPSNTAGRLYMTYRLGPLIENFGQIVIPTGLIEVTRPAQNGEAVTGRVVKMFGEVLQGQHLIAYDSSASIVMGRAEPVANGRSGKVRWIYNEPVLPSLQNFLVVDIPGGAANPGDEIELYKPRQPPTDGRELAIPELPIGKAQVLRVTRYGATAVITAQDQPKIAEGTSARVAAKIP